MATDFKSMTVAQLRQELKRRKLVQTGIKADLIDRLVAFEDEQQGKPTDEASREAADDDAPVPDHNNEATEALHSEPAASSPTEAAEPTDSLPLKAAQSEAPVADPLPSPVPEVATALSINPPADSIPIPEVILVTEIVQDIASRKRRSRSPPPPGEETTAKRARADRDSRSPSPQPEDNPSFETLPDHDFAAQTAPEIETHSEDHSRQERDWAQRLEGNQPKREEIVPMDIDEPMDEFGRVERSRHPATSALYIANLMRPLKDNDFRDHIIKIAAFPGVDPNPECVLDFYLDSIKTHAFVGFSSIAAASRVRTALHGKIYPNERIRKALWVDFIPAENIQEWVREERAERGRWIVTYDGDINGGGEVQVSHVKDSDAGKPNNSVRQPMGPPPPVPTALSRAYPAAQEPPPRVRGRGGRGFRLEQEGGEWKTTVTGPPLTYKPVSEELAERRTENMRSYYTKDRYRDIGREDEINRYTFEAVDRFVDRGKEVFIGIRPPHRQAERDRLAAGGGRRRRRNRSPRRRDDRYHGGYDDRRDDRQEDHFDDRGDDSKDDHSRYDDDWPRKDNGNDRMDRFDDRRGTRDRSPVNDIPRSRFDGAPLPTYQAPPKGGRGGRRRNWR
ncbi:hypothetical protein QBC43DRAFT_207066 [Cladorrhinum sp. PSN259]|nr:hypothetical protein QBC43DRAFT_207066 [Cladorrhinum sp. PSN259]